MIKVNGEQFQLKEICLISFLKENGYDPRQIAVECNEEIVPRADYDSFILHSGDVVEIVGLVGGG